MKISNRGIQIIPAKSDHVREKVLKNNCVTNVTVY